MTVRWSWIFILHSLLVRLGSAISPDNHVIGRDIHPLAGGINPASSTGGDSSSGGSMPRKHTGVIIAGVLGTILLALLIFVLLFLRKRKNVQHIEDGFKEGSDGWWMPELKSSFSPDPDEKGTSRFGRMREVLTHKRESRGLQTILPYPVSMSPKPPESISRPAAAAITHVPRYPSMLERSHPKPYPPPPLEDSSRMLSVAEPPHTAESDKRASRRKVQIPPKALLVPTHSRTLPGFLDRRGLRTPKSPGRRRSWLIKRPFKHPFIPLRGTDHSQFAPGGTLQMDEYHPSRQHLEARLEQVEAVTTVSKQTRLAEVIQSDVGWTAPSSAVPISARPTYI